MVFNINKYSEVYKSLDWAGIGVESWPGSQVVEESGSRALGGNSLSVSNDPMSAGNAALGDSAVNQSLESVTGGKIGDSRGEGAKDANTHGLVVVAGSVSALSVPAPALVSTTVLSHAPIVTDIGPSIGIHVEVLDVAHLGRAGILGGAGSAGGVVHHNEWCGADGQDRSASSTGSPTGTGHNSGAG